MLVMTKPTATSLIDRLPPVRGRYRANAPLDSVTWFRVGGPAEVTFRPTDRDDLAEFLADKPGDLVACLGAGNITAWANALPRELEEVYAAKDAPAAEAG